MKVGNFDKMYQAASNNSDIQSQKTRFSVSEDAQIRMITRSEWTFSKEQTMEVSEKMQKPVW